MSILSDPRRILPRWPVSRLAAFHPQWFALGGLGWLLFHVWPLLPGLFGKMFFDLLAGHQAGLTLGAIVALVAAAGLARMGVVFAATLAGTRWHFAARGLVQRNILARIFDLPGARSVPGGVDRNISTLRDDADAIAKTGDWAYDMISAVVFAGAGIAILLATNARITLFVVAPLVGVVLLAHLVRSRVERFREHSRTATADVTGTIGDLVSGVRAIQAAGKEASVVARLRKQGEARKRAVLRDELNSAWLDAVFENMASLGTGLTLLAAASSMRTGAFTVGDFVLFSTYLMQVSGYTGFVGYLARTRRQANVAFRRAAGLMQGAPRDDLVAHHPLHLSGAPAKDEWPPGDVDGDRLEELHVRGLTVRHPDSGRGIHDVDLRLRRGSLTVVTGRVGAGKTTLLRAVLGLVPAESGVICWNGNEITAPDTFMVPPSVAYTPQSPTLLSGTVRENILLGLGAGEKIGAAVRTAVLDHDLAAMPDGLDTEIGVRGRRLSGGQVLRTAAARMLVRHAHLMVFDDLSSALDVETESQLWDRILGLEATCLVVSHRRMALARADTIVVLKDGAVAGTGTLPELLDSCAEMRELLAVDAHNGSRSDGTR
ncbi:ABC transporter ATP-binding protein [Actinophytocola sp.]|jgi:ATP-binding cassette subfamily B protein|uniref:ABC transporter ATP-binding protein n=1 Tax=Actinophytocola sp. TaxID=1872138 RepID=UPI002EDAD580